MEESRGLEFTTDKGVKCLVVKDEEKQKYIIVDISEYKTMARCDYNNIKECITNIKNKY